MKRRNLNTGVRKLGPAITAAALMASGGQAFAAPVSTTLEFSCPFPLIGDQPIRAEISADIPAVATVGTPTPEFEVTALTVVNENSRTGLKLVGSETLEGTAVSYNEVVTPSRTLDQIVNLSIPQTPIPNETGEFTVPATGNAPAVNFTEQDIGEAEIRVGALSLSLIARTANGDIAPAPIGEIDTDCTQLAGQDNLLQTIMVEGNAVETPRIAVNREEVAFGNVQAGLTEQDTITITNTGNAALGINGVSISGSDSSAFMQTNSCSTIAPNEACDINVTYIPSGEGTQSATLSIASTDEDTPNVDVALSGNSVLAPIPEIGVDPQSIDLGRILVGESASARITITNSGNETLLINGISLTGSNASEFTQTNNCTTVPQDQSCTVDLAFTAGSVGVRNAQLVVASNDPENPEISVSVSAEGYEQTGSILEMLLALEGSTYINASDSTLPLNGTIATALDLAAGTFEADLAVDPTVGHFSVKLLFSKLNAVANVEFEQSEMTTGTLINGKLTANSHLYVKVPKVALKLFGIPFKVGGGDQCQTIEPVDITLVSPEGSNFSPATGGSVSGEYTLPPLENCGLLTDVLNQFLTGPGNTIDLMLTPEQ